MKKIITSTVVAFSLGAALTAPLVMAADKTELQASQKSAEQSWQDTLKTQVALAKAKVLLLQARSELWVAQNKEAALRSLDEARASLDESWHSADKATQARVSALKLQIGQAQKLLKEKGQLAEAELQLLADHSESALNAALAQAQTKSTALKNETASRYALAQAKAAALKARVALELEKSPEKAEQALKETEEALLQAKETASDITAEQIAKLQQQARVARQAVNEKSGDAKSRITTLVSDTEARIESYEKSLQESNEAKLLKKRYVQLEAQAALLKANLAMKVDATGDQAAVYLEESKAWYESLKIEASKHGEKELAKMSASIDEAKQALADKDRQARAKLSELLEQAAEVVKK